MKNRPSYSRTPYTLALLVFNLFIVGQIQASQQDFKVLPPGNSTVSGRVSVDGQPIEGLRILLISATESNAQPSIIGQTTSDQDGVFRFTQVPTGAFTVTTEPGAFVFADEDSRRSFGKPVVIATGQNVSDVRLELQRGGIITGRVVNAEGEPVITQPVSIQKLDDRGKKHNVSLPNQPGTTDDLGVFRIYGLPAGKYIVSIRKRAAPIHSDSLNSYTPTTYYPSVLEEAQAIPVEVKQGTEVRGVDITLAEPIATHSALGKVVNPETGNGIPNIAVTYMRTADVGSTDRQRPREVKTDAGGGFRLDNLRPGEYVAYLVPRDGFYSEKVPFEVADADIQGLELKGLKGSTLSGFVQAPDAGAVTLSSRLDQLFVSGMQMDRSRNPGGVVSSTTRLNADGTFVLNGLRPGHVKLTITGPLKAISLARVELDGVDRTQGIEVGSQESIAGVKLILAYGVGHIAGQVTTRNGPLPIGSKTSVTATSLAASAPKRVFANVNSEGRFTFLDLPAGDYEISVTSRLPSLNGRNSVLSSKKSVGVKTGLVLEAVFILDPTGK